MKIDATVLRETRFVAVGTLFFAACEQLAFLAFGAWGLDVLLGTLLSGAAGVVNFLLLGLTIQRALAFSDAEQAKQVMKLSRSARMMGLLAVLAVGVFLDVFSTVAVLVTVFFPRLVLIVRQMVLARRGEAVYAGAWEPGQQTGDEEGGAAADEDE